MTKNLTILTAIVITAATTAGGTYYLTTNSQAGNTPANAPVAVTPQTENDQPVFQVATQDMDKPITIVVKTQIEEAKQPRKSTKHIRDLKQPTLRVMPD